MSEFIEVNVEECEGIDAAVCLRFKKADVTTRTIVKLWYENESGQEGEWSVSAADATSKSVGPATAYRVEDSSDGVVWLVVGGSGGLLLTHASGDTERVAYLVLARI